MSGHSFELDAYLDRIGYGGPREASLAVLRSLIAQHTATIPFENIDIFLGRGASLDLEQLQAKMVAGRRGGYCFEQNTLLREALVALGFRVTGLMARVVRGLENDAVTPRTHMTLLVDLPEGSFLADVGFGNLTPTAPLALIAERAQPTAHEPFRLLEAGDEWLLQAHLGEVWRNVYRFPLQPQFDIDYEVGNWFTSTRPGGMFVSNLIVARPGHDCRMTLFNDRFVLRGADGRVERQTIKGASHYGETLRAFGLTLSDGDHAALADAVSLVASAEPHPFFV